MDINYYSVKKIKTISELMNNAVKEAKDAIAFEYKKNKTNIKISYKEFQNDTFYLGTSLYNMNMESSHIACIGPNSYEWLTVYLTVLKSNGVFVPIDKDLPINEIENILNNSDSEILFFDKKYEKYIEEFKNNLPKIKYYICFQYEEHKNNILSYSQLLLTGKKLFKSGKKDYINIKHTDTNKLKLLVYTSGTTGNPKGVMLSEHNLVSSIYYGLQVSTVYTKCLSVLPYHHTYEAVAGILVALHKHVTICINDSLKNTLKNLEYYKPDYIYLVPAFAEMFYKNILSSAKKEKKEKLLKFLIVLSNTLRKVGIDKRKKIFKSIHESFGGNLKKIVVGGAPVRNEIGIFFDNIGIPLINGYGITECSPLVSANMDNFNDPSTVGIVLPCCQIKFENTTKEGEGEICIKGDIVMLGYYKDPKRTAKVLKDGWFNTEDIGKFNDKKQLIITGRKKNVIVLKNGKNIYPEELENYILKIPYISECIVKANKNPSGEETSLCAEVFLNKEKIDELKIENPYEALKKDIKKITKDLPAYKKITIIKIREKEFNKTTTNKIKR